MNKNLKINIKEMEEHKTILQSYPVKIYLETTQKCNLKCVMCDIETYSHEKLDFPIDLFNKITPLFEGAEELHFYYVGEPCLSKNLVLFLNETTDYSFLPKVFTNGTILDEQILSIFDKRGVFVYISLESATKRIYENIRRGASFENFVKNINQYVYTYKSRSNDRFHLRLSATIAIDNLPEILNIIEFAKTVGIPDVLFGPIDFGLFSNRHLTCDDKKAVYYFERGKELADKYKIRFLCPQKIGNYIIENNDNWKNFSLPIDKFKYESIEKYNYNPITMVCGYPWMQTIIRANGDVVSCCHGRHVMGNLYENSFDEIWNGKRYQTLRLQKDFNKCMGKGCNMVKYYYGEKNL